VISEGCDFPWLRRLIDARPQASPVSWVQQIGRIMRPGERRPEYLCLCRNLERHAWLMQGGVPRAKIAEAQQAFEKPSKRQDSRSIGLESLRRFKRIDIPLLGGIVGSAYALYSLDSDTGIKTEWLTILDPCSDAAIYATRSVAPPDTAQPGKRKRRSNSCYGKWQLTEAPGDGFVGYATSSQRGALSEKQAAWWTRSAATHGLEPRAASELTRRQFQVLPVLSDCKVRVTGG